MAFPFDNQFSIIETMTALFRLILLCCNFIKFEYYLHV